MRLLICLLIGILSCTTAAFSDDLSNIQQLDLPVLLSDRRIRWQGREWQLVDQSTDLILPNHDSEHSLSLFSYLDDESPESIDYSEPINLLDDKQAHKTSKKSLKANAKQDKKHHSNEAVLYSPQWWLMSFGAFTCVIAAAIASGLTMGVVSIDPFDLQVILSTDDEDCETDEELEELRLNKQYAARLLPVVQRHHFVLVTLLVLNSLANECMPLFLDRLVPAWLAVLMSVTLVLVVGEIYPAAVFTGSSQLRLATRLVPVVWFFMFIFAPIAWPIAKFLDWLLGADDDGIEYFKRGELKALIKLQGAQASDPLLSHAMSVDQSLNKSINQSINQLAHAGLSTDEINMLHGTLEFKSQTVGEVCLPFDKVFMLEIDDRLDADCLASILAKGYSRVPIFERNRSNIKGILLIKRLIVIAPEHRRVIRSLVLRRAMFISKDMSLFDCLNEFQSGISHLAIVCSDPVAAQAASQSNNPMPDSVEMFGIITLEDLIERLIKEPISDESDSAPHTVRALLEESRLQRARASWVKSIAKKLRPSTLKKIHPSISPHHPYHPWSGRRGADDEKSLSIRRVSESTNHSGHHRINSYMINQSLSPSFNQSINQSNHSNHINNYGSMSSIVVDTSSNEQDDIIEPSKRNSVRWSSLAHRLGLDGKGMKPL